MRAAARRIYIYIYIYIHVNVYMSLQPLRRRAPLGSDWPYGPQFSILFLVGEIRAICEIGYGQSRDRMSDVRGDRIACGRWCLCVCHFGVGIRLRGCIHLDFARGLSRVTWLAKNNHRFWKVTGDHPPPPQIWSTHKALMILETFDASCVINCNF